MQELPLDQIAVELGFCPFREADGDVLLLLEELVDSSRHSG